MNRNGHLISSQFILVLVMGTFLIFLLRDYGALDVLIATVWSIICFIWGVLVPDLDHQKVQENFKLKWLLSRITKHRGHMHSIFAICVYGSIIGILTYFLGVVFWYFPVISGTLGYFSHLLEDQVKKWFDGSQAKNTLKLF